MRKLMFIGLVGAIAAPTLVAAQTKEIHRDEQKVEDQHRDLQDAIQSGDPKAIEHKAHDERKAQDELRKDRQHFARDQYVAPYHDWAYTPVAPGTKLRSRFYGSDYSVSDPASYQLRPAMGDQRWVRYGNDLVLVNLRNGQVVEVASGRF